MILRVALRNSLIGTEEDRIAPVKLMPQLGLPHSGEEHGLGYVRL